MKVLLIPDSFKDSISATEINEALERGLKKVYPAIDIHAIAGSDGGEGFLESVLSQLDVEQVYHDTLDPIGRPIEAYYLLDKTRGNAFIELAQASGLELLTENERNPLFTTTAGTGLQIMHAINKGARTIYIGMGGSATNDGGIGLASVMGYSFIDREDQPLLPTGGNLDKIIRIEGHYKFPEIKVIGISDVTNHLSGAEGAAFTFAQQKGASSEDIQLLENGILNLARIVKDQLNKNLDQVNGSGAAGGTGFGLMAFLNAELRPGIEFILELAGIDKLLKDKQFDLIITGEGRIDHQSFKGKLIDGVIRAAKPYDIPVMAICGQLKLSEAEWRAFGLDYATTIAPEGVEAKESMARASEFIENIAAELLAHLNQ